MIKEPCYKVDHELYGGQIFEDADRAVQAAELTATTIIRSGRARRVKIAVLVRKTSEYSGLAQWLPYQTVTAELRITTLGEE